MANDEVDELVTPTDSESSDNGKDMKVQIKEIFKNGDRELTNDEVDELVTPADSESSDNEKDMKVEVKEIFKNVVIEK
ncbi:hypothetical protein AVEN_196276-1 [Araneus ventricosus]|uniref:Uncharacterized protein n=1 Tax=Araneus ventricosus TaxID=182803 RepID=A0A4Y2T6M5_ARAVE|nr:hypothetical protein AVEN_196276-1 [Araneus ventricosus]